MSPDRAKILKLKDWTLLDIAEHYGFSFSPVGDKMRGLCRFHGDTNTPNFFLYPEDNFFCYSCRRGGDKAAFVAYAEHSTWREVKSIWEGSTPLQDRMAIRLVDRKANYKPQVLLLLSKFCYNSLHSKTDGVMDLLQDIDVDLRGKKFVDLVEYNAIVKKLHSFSGVENV